MQLSRVKIYNSDAFINCTHNNNIHSWSYTHSSQNKVWVGDDGCCWMWYNFLHFIYLLSWHKHNMQSWSYTNGSQSMCGWMMNYDCGMWLNGVSQCFTTPWWRVQFGTACVCCSLSTSSRLSTLPPGRSGRPPACTWDNHTHRGKENGIKEVWYFLLYKTWRI